MWTKGGEVTVALALAEEFTWHVATVRDGIIPAKTQQRLIYQVRCKTLEPSGVTLCCYVRETRTLELECILDQVWLSAVNTKERCCLEFLILDSFLLHATA